MEKLQNFILGLLIIASLGLFVFLFNKFVLTKSSYLSVNSSVAASVYIDNTFKGQTPLKIKLNQGQTLVKVVANANIFSPFETNITIHQNTTSVVGVVFSEEGNSSTVVYFDRSDSSEPQIAVVSVPNLSKVKIDGQMRGFSPVKINTSEGNHTIESEFEGYKKELIDVEAKPGLRTVVLFALAADPSFVATTQPTISPSLSPIATVKQIEILDTPTGFLKVREDASSSSSELGQVKPGEKYTYIESNEDNSWHKIEFNNSTGWVSAQYSKIIEE